MFKTSFIAALVLCLGIPNSYSFCGFYVAKADTKLFNETSQVILVRDGNKTSITMSNDFKGDVKDFAMVVPVPVILREQDIKVVDQSIFDRFDDYSAPRMAAYYDEEPCPQPVPDMYYSYDAVDSENNEMVMSAAPDLRPTKHTGVTIEAKYTIDEYDILILSATESSGLKRWLTDNDYKIPEGAEEVLDPYIKSDLKFFVVKVNLENQKKSGFQSLRPIRISFESEKFMLPIRLGMANSKGSQDLIVYAFTKGGRIETTNYRTIKIPTDNEIPLFVQNEFGSFYNDVFDRVHAHRSKSVFLEYAWDLSANNVVKCDPCVSPPPIIADMQNAGVDWLTTPANTFSNQYQGEVFFTRLHIRYNRENFPQDLFFQETPNAERFQGRYVIHHPATGPFDCDRGQEYLKNLVDRREAELEELAALTGWGIMKYKDYVSKYSTMINGEPIPELLNEDPQPKTIIIEAPVDPVQNTNTIGGDENQPDPNEPKIVEAQAVLPDPTTEKANEITPSVNTAIPAANPSNWYSNPWIVGALFMLALAALLKVIGFPKRKPTDD
jgi:hypothetical protein